MRDWKDLWIDTLFTFPPRDLKTAVFCRERPMQWNGSLCSMTVYVLVPVEESFNRNNCNYGKKCDSTETVW